MAFALRCFPKEESQEVVEGFSFLFDARNNALHVDRDRDNNNNGKVVFQPGARFSPLCFWQV